MSEKELSQEEVLAQKKKAVDATLNNIKKRFGAGSIQILGDTPTEQPCLPTGILPLDLAIGIGGLPKGKIVEIYGPESAGKTLLTLCAIAQTQKAGGICAFIDAEYALNTKFAENVGVDIDSLILSQPNDGEEALEIVEQLIRSGGIDLIVVDSVAALVPRAEIEGDMIDQQVGLHARLMSKGLRKITSVAAQNDTTVIFINQLREKVGVIYGNPETTTGGRALKFYSSLRLDVRKVQQLKNGTETVGNKIRVKVVKNKVAAPFKEAEFDLIFNSGVDNEGCIVDAGVKLGIIEKSGAWLSYKDNTMHCQGREKASQFLRDNPEVREELLNLIRENN